MLRPKPDWQKNGFIEPLSNSRTEGGLHSGRLEKLRKQPIAGSTVSIIGVKKTKRAKMQPEFAAMALVGGHYDIVKTVIWDITDPAARAFFLLKLSQEYGRLLQDQDLADEMLRRLL